jgi:two-component system, cell cycle sensor histidine kinase and response regulator CckA
MILPRVSPQFLGIAALGLALALAVAVATPYGTSPFLFVAGLVIATVALVIARPKPSPAAAEGADFPSGLVDSAGVAIIAAGINGDVRYLNPAAEALTGWSLADARGMALSRIIGESDDLNGGGEAAEIELVVTHHEGHRIDAAGCRSVLRDRAGEVTGTLIVVVDTATRRRAEAKLRQNDERLQQSRKLEAIGRLAGGVAHDFNNLITGIRGFAQFGLEGLPEGSPVRPDLEEIQRSADRAASLTRQLLAFGRQQVFQSRVLDLNAIVLDTNRMLRRLIGENVRIIARLQAGLGYIRADAGQIEHILVNLALNARDAMPDGGELLIETREAVLTDEDAMRSPFEVRPGNYVLLALRDSGTGMDRETLDRIFEPFFTTKAGGLGAGLGLSTVYGIVKQSGGYIYVDSEPGKGTSTRIYLPRANGVELRAPPETATKSPSSNGETVLLVEDDDTVRALTRRVLSRQGYRVIEARNGIEALSIAEPADQIIDIVISDIVMPELGGRQLVEQLRRLRPGLPVLLMSGYTDDAIARQGITESGEPFLAKPFTTDALARKVRSLLDSGLN